MKVKALYVATALIACVSTAQAQTPTIQNKMIKVTSAEAVRNGNRVDMAFTANYDDLIMNPRGEVIATPIIIKGRDTTEMEPIVFMGKVRDRIDYRETTLGNNDSNYGEPYEQIVMSRKEARLKKTELWRYGRIAPKGEDIIYTASFPYQSWMDGSKISLRQDIMECGKDYATLYTPVTSMATPVDAALVILVPDPPKKKIKTDKMCAQIDFVVNRSDIQRNLRGNAEELDRIYKFTDEVMADKSADVEAITIKGYASPEASYEYNTRLSMERANALKNNLVQKYSLKESMITVESDSEDWDSLRNWIVASDLKYRTELLGIIDDTKDPDARDAKIKALDKGVTYSKLLHDVYPQLRRADYSIHSVVKPTTLTDARNTMATNPQSMDIDDMYIVLISYPQQSDDYHRTLNTMARYYPNDVIVNNNMAVAAMNAGDLKTARQHLDKVKNDPRCHNNMGVLHVREGNRTEAERYLRMASQNGSREARHNLDNLSNLR